MRALAFLPRATIAALSALSFGAVLAPQTRDAAPAAAPVGSAVVAGRVVSVDAQSAAVRHATVTLGGGNLRGTRDVITDDQGRFAFTGLAAGAYTLSAAKTAWVTSYYGGRRPGMRPFAAAPLVITDGERNTDIELRMLHGSAITGVVRDAAGAPANADVELMQFRVIGGVRSVAWVPGTNTGAVTDDHGVYRLFGLAPGEYLVSSRKTSVGEDLHLTTSDMLHSPQTLSSGSLPALSAPPDPGRAVAFTSVYYPGTVDVGAATILKIGANEEKTDIDFALQLVPTARISGSVVGIDGRPPVAAMIHLEFPTVRPEGDGLGDVGYAASVTVETNQDGTFAMAAVPPGHYRIVIRADDPGATPTGRGRASLGGTRSLWAAQEITVDGHDVSGLTLMVQPGMTVGGRVSAATSVDLTKCTVALKPVIAGDIESRAAVETDGAFTFSGVMPGWYRLDAAGTMPGGCAKIASARIGQSDIADLPFEVLPSTDITNMAVTLSAALGEVAGTLKDAADRPAPHYVVVIFSADRAYWTSKNRRMPAPTETLADGRFHIGDLPAGEYFIFTAADIDPDSLGDPAVLEQLASQALKLTLGEGEKKVQDFRLSGGSETALFLDNQSGVRR